MFDYWLVTVFSIVSLTALNFKFRKLSVMIFNGLDWSFLGKHLVIGDIHNSWSYFFTNPFERVSLSYLWWLKICQLSSVDRILLSSKLTWSTQDLGKESLTSSSPFRMFPVHAFASSLSVWEKYQSNLRNVFENVNTTYIVFSLSIGLDGCPNTGIVVSSTVWCNFFGAKNVVPGIRHRMSNGGYVSVYACMCK